MLKRFPARLKFASGLAAAVLAGLILAPALSQAQAQSPVSFASLMVDLWPEYDRPGVLVIYHIALVDGTKLPVQVGVHIPAAAGEPANIAKNENGNLFIIDHTRTVSGDWALISFQAETLETQVEYYDPALVKNGTTRTFSFEWQGDAAVNEFSVDVQQPVGASAMTITPSLGSNFTGSDGLIYYLSMLGPRAAGEKFKVDLQYQKASDQLSGPAVVKPNNPINTQTPGRLPSTNEILLWTLGGVGVLLIAGGGLWFWRTGLSQPNRAFAARRRHAPRQRTLQAGETTPADAAGAIYCHQCGRRAQPGDLFCRACGTKFRL